MLSSISNSTLKQYLPSIVDWTKYCNLNNLNIYSPSISDVIIYLTKKFHEGLSYGSLNSLRSALSLLVGSHLGTDSGIRRLFKGFYKLRPTAPKYNSTWDVSILLNYIENKYCDSNNLLINTKKTVSLLALATGQRAQTISLINIKNIIIKTDCITIKIDKLIKTSAPNRYQPFLTIPFFNDKENICPARAVIKYMEITREIRQCDNLFITTKKPYKSVTASTISRWIKNTMKESGIDMSVFSAHSTRHASCSVAFERGVNIDNIRRTAGWTGVSNTFGRFYNRPIIDNKEFAEAIFK